MADETYTAEQIRITHRRGHSLPLHERAREDAARADVLITTNDALLEVGDLFDGEMLVVSGAQVISAPVPGGGGGDITAVTAGAGLTGGGVTGAVTLAVDFGTGTNQARRGDDAAYTDARTPLAHNQSISTITGLGTGVATALGNAVTGSGSVVLDTSPTLVTPALGTPSALVLTNATGLPASGVSSGTLDLARMTTATAGQQLRVDSSGTAVVGFFEPIDILAGTGTTTNTTPATLLSISLPEAGTYLVEGVFAYVVGSVTGTRTQTATINVTNLTSMNIGAIFGTSAPASGSRTPITSSGSSVTVGLTTGLTGFVHPFGLVTVSAAATFSVDFSVSGDTGTLRGGSFLKATRKA